MERLSLAEEVFSVVAVALLILGEASFWIGWSHSFVVWLVAGVGNQASSTFCKGATSISFLISSTGAIGSDLLFERKKKKKALF